MFLLWPKSRGDRISASRNNRWAVAEFTKLRTEKKTGKKKKPSDRISGVINQAVACRWPADDDDDLERGGCQKKKSRLCGLPIGWIPAERGAIGSRQCTSTPSSELRNERRPMRANQDGLSRRSKHWKNTRNKEGKTSRSTVVV